MLPEGLRLLGKWRKSPYERGLSTGPIHPLVRSFPLSIIIIVVIIIVIVIVIVIIMVTMIRTHRRKPLVQEHALGQSLSNATLVPRSLER